MKKNEKEPNKAEIEETEKRHKYLIREFATEDEIMNEKTYKRECLSNMCSNVRPVVDNYKIRKF